MLKKKKFAALFLTMSLCAGIISGCGGNNQTDQTPAAPASDTASKTAEAEDSGTLDTSKEVELVMYIISDRPAGQDVVDENLNKLLKEKLNCTLKINWLGWAEYVNKYPLLFSSGEQFDIAYASSTWLNYVAMAQKGAFKNLDELWPKYAPENYAATSETAKQLATVNGSYYCVPTQLATYSAFGMIYREDLVEGSDWDGVMETYEDVEEYCDLVKELHPEMEPIDQYQTTPFWYYTYMGYEGQQYVDRNYHYMWFDPYEENPHIITPWEYEGTMDFLKMMSRFSEKGFFTKSALSDTDSQKQETGKAALRIHNVDNYAQIATLHPDWDIKYANFVKNVSHLPFTTDSMVISNTSKNPERAMALWNLITTDQEVYDALMYGVEGMTYELNESGQYMLLDTDLYSTSAMWAARTNELNRNQAGTPEDYDTMRKEWDDAIVPGEGPERFAGFVFDTTNVTSEISACANVQQQYWWPLELGYVDAESGFAEYEEKMKAAGIEKIVEEAQRQLDEYLGVE